MRKGYLLFLICLLLALSAVSVASQDMMYSESPMLADRVAAGDLPPVEERLPVSPEVVTPTSEVVS